VQLGMGYIVNHPPAVIGYKVETASGNTKGQIFFATRDDTADIAPTERLRIHPSGIVSIPEGIELGSGLDSTAANVLDDYEEGTWTPVLGGSGGTSGQTYGIQAGTYTKVGDMCIASGYLTLQAKGTISNTLQLKGLPFTTRNVTNNIGAAAIARVEAWSLADDHTLCCHFGENGTAGTFTSYAGATSSHSTLTTSEVTNTSSIIFSLTYHTT
jgi:hypothetical protein